MKKIAIILFLLNYTSIGFSQVNKHAWMLGGSISLQQENSFGDTKISTFNAQPYVGFFLSNHFVLGIRPHFLSSLRKSTLNDSKTREIGMGAFARFYPFHKTKVLPFAQAGFQRVNYRIRQTGQTQANPIEGYENTVFGGVGLDYFITPNVALEGNLEYTSTTTQVLSADKNSLAFRIGFQVFLHNTPN